MFRIKICGVTSYADAQAATEAGADALGFNFCRFSQRFIAYEDARQIARFVPELVMRVGVFANHEPSDIRKAIEQLRLDYIQLHGDETAQYVVEMPPGIKIVRAWRCGGDGLATLASYLSECRTLGRAPDAVLLDSSVGGNFGGTGRTLDWRLIAQQRPVLGDILVVLAGGLAPGNVGSAIAAVRPDAVDVASGVERQPGVKDVELVKRFVVAASEAFDRI
jgi:phosphoribosylanthranilate isomerase